MRKFSDFAVIYDIADKCIASLGNPKRKTSMTNGPMSYNKITV